MSARSELGRREQQLRRLEHMRERALKLEDHDLVERLESALRSTAPLLEAAADAVREENEAQQTGGRT